MSLWTRHHACSGRLRQLNASAGTVIRQLTVQHAEDTQASIRKSNARSLGWAQERSPPPSRETGPGFKPRRRPRPAPLRYPREESSSEPVDVDIDQQSYSLNPIFLRDLCPCPLCKDPSTKQKHFATADIPLSIRSRAVSNNGETVSIQWLDDIPGWGEDHVTAIPTSTLRAYLEYGDLHPKQSQRPKTLWDAQMFTEQTKDIDYESYINDDSVLFQALQQLHTHGLVFVSNVPESDKSVETLGERIGPLKTTFYGRTWDVRSVPNAINVAYTAQNLGFHMDLMYMEQPPHLQLLHCIRSSATGGASLFADSLKAANDLSSMDQESYFTLSRLSVDYHYDHPGSQYYHQRRPVIEEIPNSVNGKLCRNYRHYMNSQSSSDESNSVTPKLTAVDFIGHISWSPPFQGPFSLASAQSLHGDAAARSTSQNKAARALSVKVSSWHKAAQRFNQLIHRPEAIYERLMKPGECVIFDNRRVLHARRTFEVGDAGKERWLRGAYLDKDPYVSKLKILHDKYPTSE